MSDITITDIINTGSTVAIAVFTFILIIVAFKQNKIASKQNEIAQAVLMPILEIKQQIESKGWYKRDHDEVYYQGEDADNTIIILKLINITQNIAKDVEIKIEGSDNKNISDIFPGQTLSISFEKGKAISSYQKYGLRITYKSILGKPQVYQTEIIHLDWNRKMALEDDLIIDETLSID